MNTYNENLQQTVVNTLSAMSLDEANLDSIKTVAEIDLYQAQGAEITARNKLASTTINKGVWQAINDQARFNESQAFNLLASATEANTDVTTCVTNTATAASNVQIASNAISLLSADIGAALNIAKASLYDTDVYSRIVNANSFINEVANESKRIAKNAMNASSYTSEVTTSEVLAQTQTINTKFDAIFNASQATLDGFATLAIAESGQITLASQTERKAEGALKDADREVQAIVEAYANANGQMNLGLDVAVISGTQIGVTFSALPNPLPTFKSDDAAKIIIPPADPKYFLALLPAQSQSTFGLDQAQQIFAQNPERFLQLGAPAVSTQVTLGKDVNGNAVAAGTSYVAYLYIELSKLYKQFISNFSDMLSAPSQSFVPATTLPTPIGLTYSYRSPSPEGAWTTALFDVPSLYSQNDAASGKVVADSANAVKAADEAAAASASYKEASIAATAASKNAAAATAFAVATAADAAQKSAAATEAAAAATAATAAVNQATEAVLAARLAADEANAAMKANTTPTTKAAATVANKKLAAAQTAETKAIADAATANANATALQESANAAQTAKSSADEAMKAAEVLAVKTAASANSAQVAAQAAAAKAAAAKVAAEAATAVTDAVTFNPPFAGAELEYRCILMERTLEPDPGFLLCERENNNPPLYFNLTLAEQVSPANYITAMLAQTPQLLYEVEFAPGATDNFGNVIKQGVEYRPYILAIAGGETADQFVNVLAGPFDPVVVWKQ